MKKHIQYLWYVVKHKWYVFLECRKQGIIWLGITHDWSKFLPSEWFPYVNFFYGEPKKDIRDETGYYKPYNTGDVKFDFAWLLHQKRNKHHWQYWILAQDDGKTMVFNIPRKYRKEMLADWIGAGKAQGTPNTKIWYEKNKDKMALHKATRLLLEKDLQI